jgi:hypothetical protein
MYSSGDIFGAGNSFNGGADTLCTGTAVRGERLVAEAKIYRWLSPIQAGAVA